MTMKTPSDSSDAIKVVIADDHSVVRQGIKSILEQSEVPIRVIDELENGREVLALIKRQSVDVFILDITMPYLNGIETTLRLRKINPDQKIIVLTMHDDRATVGYALKAGVNGYLSKESAVENIVEAVLAVYAGKYYLSSSISKYVVDGYLGKNGLTQFEMLQVLTSKEREIVQLLAEGFVSKEIASQLNMSFHTVNTHRKNIIKKTNSNNLAELIRYALKNGLAKL